MFVIHRILAVPALLHELCHYIPALLLGLNPRIDASWRLTRHTRTTPAKRMVVGLTPAVVGLVGLAGAIRLLYDNPLPIHHLWLVFHALVWLNWLSLSANDLQRVIRFLVEKDYPEAK